MASRPAPFPAPSHRAAQAPFPDDMWAATRHVYGGPDVVAVERVERPEPGEGEVLLRVRAAGLDRATLHLLTGLPLLARAAFGPRRPRQPVLGQQVAGEVAAVGAGASAFAVGDRVLGTAAGSFAQFAVAKVEKIAPVPDSVTDVAAATLGVSGLTALQAVDTHGIIRGGQRVLVLGASGAVGSFVVQLAARRGAHVTGVCSAGKTDFVRSLGAAAVQDYRAVTLADMGGPFDAIIDIAGNRSVAQLRRALTGQGRLVVVGGEDGGTFLGGIERNLWLTVANHFTRRELSWFFSRTSGEACAALAAECAAGTVEPAVDRVVSLGEVGSALSAMERGELMGQAVVTP